MNSPLASRSLHRIQANKQKPFCFIYPIIFQSILGKTLSLFSYPIRLEDLFQAQGVDLVVQAHEHSYERLWPVYDYQVTAKNYIDPQAPVHVISGAAGCGENVDYMGEPSKSRQTNRVFPSRRSLWCYIYLSTTVQA